MNTLDISKILSTLKITHYDFDPDGTSAVDVGWIDMRDYIGVAMSFFRTIGTSALTVTVIANTEADGSGTDYAVKTITPSAAPDAVGDYVFWEVLAEEIAQIGSENDVELRGVSAALAFATGTDEGVITYIGDPVRNKYGSLTADSVVT